MTLPYNGLPAKLQFIVFFVVAFVAHHKMLWCAKRWGKFCIIFFHEMPLFHGGSCAIMTITD